MDRTRVDTQVRKKGDAAGSARRLPAGLPTDPYVPN